MSLIFHFETPQGSLVQIEDLKLMFRVPKDSQLVSVSVAGVTQ